MNMPNKKALTLIELLVAISIFSITIIALYSTFHTGILAYKKIKGITSLYQNARITLERLSQDLENSFPYSAEDPGFIGAPQGISFFSLIKFYSDFGNQPHVFKVEYRLNNGRLERLLYLSYDESKALYESPLSEIDQIKFSYAFAKADTPFYEWKDYWQEKDNIPQAVKIDLVVSDTQTKQSIKFSKVVYIPQGALVEGKL